MDEKILVTRSSMPPFEEYAEIIKPLWESRWLTNMGMYHRQLEEKIKEYTGADYVSLVVNGHMALELAIQSMNFPEGAEVITTPFTFISTTHAIIRNKLKPVFCDIKPDDYTIDEKKIENLITEKTVAIVPVHVYGNPCNVEKIAEIAARYDLKVIYDACHAFGEVYKGRGIGSYGDMSVFSFHATKVFNTIEGGAIVCHSAEQYDRLYNLKNFGIRSEELVVSVGANAKMNEFSAAMGLCNLKYIDENIKRRRNIVNTYLKCFEGCHSVQLNRYNNQLMPNYAYMPILLNSRRVRDRVYEALKKENIYSRKYFYPITADAECFRNKYKNVPLDIARDCSERILVLPLYDSLEECEVKRIAQVVKLCVQEDTDLDIKEEIVVSVMVLTYNHEEYVRQALDSIVSQKTNFKYEVLVGDDCSSDNTQNIIREYAEKYSDIIIPVLRQENTGGKKNLYDLMMKCRGKYIAYLEGDDYWCNVNKLQLQVDFLEKNLQYIGCAHKFMVVNRKGIPYYDRDFQIQFIEGNIYTLKDYEEGKFASHFNSMVCRNIYGGGY